MRRVALILLTLALGLGMSLFMNKPHVELRDSFKPEPTPLELEMVGMPSVKGKATWFDAQRGGQSTWYVREGYKFYAAAGPKLRKLCGKKCDFKWGKPPYRIIVTNLASGRSIVAWVVDWCQCREGKNEKLVDLSPEAWRAVAGPDTPLSRGVLKVKVEVIP